METLHKKIDSLPSLQDQVVELIEKKIKERSRYNSPDESVELDILQELLSEYKTIK